MTAEDLWPLVAKLSRTEQVRLARLALARSAVGHSRSDAEAYAAQPVGPDEFSTGDDDPMAWDAEGWDDL